MSKKNFKTINETIEGTKKYHKQYLKAVNNSKRREILRAIQEGFRTFEELKSHTELDDDILSWHLNVLKHGFCVEKVIKDRKLFYLLTQEGKVVNYL